MLQMQVNVIKNSLDLHGVHETRLFPLEAAKCFEANIIVILVTSEYS